MCYFNINTSPKVSEQRSKVSPTTLLLTPTNHKGVLQVEGKEGFPTRYYVVTGVIVLFIIIKVYTSMWSDTPNKPVNSNNNTFDVNNNDHVELILENKPD